MKSIRFSLLLLVSGVSFFGQADPPTRIGRIGYIQGSVSFQPAGIEDWLPVSPNRPITTGDQIWVDDGARAEMHVGSTALRLGSQTSFQFLELDDSAAQIQLSTGVLNLHIQYLAPDQIFEVDTPNLAFTIFHPGDYRIDAQPDENITFVTVRSGNGEVTGGGQAFDLNPGQQAAVSGNQSIYFDVYSAPVPDWWDNWCQDREVREEHLPALRYVHAELTGFIDLDDHGYWQGSPYGEVWVPRDVPVGWAPYHYGHWSWIDPWGWTWVDDASWGFAPFHYGRWAFWNNTWAWVPGPLANPPVYAPALVAWVGGAGFGASFSFGGAAVAWVPLGPREVYVPPYHVSAAYVTQINTSGTVIANFNVTNVYNITHVTYVNASVPNAVVAVSAQSMASAQSVHEVSRPVSAAQFSSAQVIRAAQVAPQRQAVVGHAAATANVPHPPAAILKTPVVARHAPPPPPIPFAQKQQALQKNPGVPLDPQQTQQIRKSSPPPKRAMVVQQAPAAHKVQPTVATQPPARAMKAIQARPTAQPPSGTPTPAQGNKPAPPPAPVPAPKVEEKKAPPPAAPKVEEKKAAAPPHVTTKPAGTEAPKVEEKKAAPPAAPKVEEKKAAAPAHATTKPAGTGAPKVEEKKTPPPAAPKVEEKKTPPPAAPKVEEKKAPPPEAAKPATTKATTKKTTKPRETTEKEKE